MANNSNSKNTSPRENVLPSPRRERERERVVHSLEHQQHLQQHRYSTASNIQLRGGEDVSPQLQSHSRWHGSRYEIENYLTRSAEVPKTIRRGSLSTSMGAGKGMGMGLHASSLKARLIASVPRDAVTPVHSRVHAREHLMMGAGAISPLDLRLKHTPGLFVTPGLASPLGSPASFHGAGTATPSHRDPFHSLFNTPDEERFKPTPTYTPSNPSTSQQTNPRRVQQQSLSQQGENENARPAARLRPKLVNEDSAKKAAEVLKEGMKSWHVKKRQLGLEDSIALERKMVAKKASPRKGKGTKRRLPDDELIFARELSPSPEVEVEIVSMSPQQGIGSRGSGSRSSADDSVRGAGGNGTPDTTPQRKKRKSVTTSTSEESAATNEHDDKTSTSTSSASTPSPQKTLLPSHLSPGTKNAGAVVKPRMTKHQQMLRKAREQEEIRARDVSVISRGFREGKGAGLGLGDGGVY